MGINFKMNADNRGPVKAALTESVERALLAIGAQCEGHAKVELSNTPKRIDTGLLRNSITYALAGEPPQKSRYSGDRPPRSNPKASVPSGVYAGQAPSVKGHEQAVYVGTNVEYATYVHNGTSRMAPNHFLKNAVVKNRDEYKAIIKKFLSDA